ncbi:phosphoserine phosphatase SerB [Xanthobacter dioxanivorans]|uniref:Phosphoserine phosphatase n=1 Tax=Xanthobacter dioxanivorans TaxID=2528964 RepID=A0A974PKB3_9HYPH|nr:phosphoserine phosphatase SerB [Xanthobacter dioxanivorans]QRG04968.1 phosphoserine phosphatase SerB [Xanthobacter dioxanivorans]
MAYVATLISNPSAPALTREAIHDARAVLPQAQDAVVLAPDVAVDIHFAPDLGADARALADAVRAALGDAPIDVVVQFEAARRKRLFLADMDSTMIGQECIDELADLVGVKAHVSAITERAMRGEIAFEPALRERVALLRGLPAGVVADVLRDRITLTPGGPELVGTMKANGAYTALVSGGFTLFTGAIAARLGFDEHRANTLLIDEDRFVGAVQEPILGRDAKLAALVELRDTMHLAPSETMAVGDGANDLAMLAEAGLGIAFRAKPAVAAAAHARIDHGDLTALLFMQGYTQAEFHTL